MIYRGDFNKAKKTYASFPVTYLNAKKVMEIFCQRWEEVPIQMSAQKETYLAKLNGVTINFKKGEALTPEDSYLHIAVQLLLAEYYFTNHDFIRALWHAKKTYPLVLKTFAKENPDPEVLFIKGLYLYYIAYYKEKNFYYRTALWPFRDGDRKEGLTLLRQAAASKSLAQTESLIYLAHIHLHIEKTPLEALPYSKKLWEEYPQNLKFKELYINNLIDAGYYEECAPLLTEQLAVENPYYKIPALYFSGCLNLNGNKNREEAEKTFNECIRLADKYRLSDDYKSKAQIKLEKLR